MEIKNVDEQYIYICGEQMRNMMSKSSFEVTIDKMPDARWLC